jgi:hypothetical protein
VEPVGPLEAGSGDEAVRVCSAVSVSDCGGSSGLVGCPCDTEAVAILVVVTRGAVYVTGTKGGSVEATDDKIDSVVPVPVTRSGARAGAGYGCTIDASETEVAAVV